MRGKCWGWVLLVGLLLMLAGCSGSGAGVPTAMPSPPPTAVPTATPAPDAAATVEQALQALEVQDEVGLRRLMDPTLGTLGALLPGNALANWRSYREVLPPDPMGPRAFGPVQGWELEPAVVRGQTTEIVAHVRHDTGRVDWTFSLAQTPDGWRLSDIRSADIRPTLEPLP